MNDQNFKNLPQNKIRFSLNVENPQNVFLIEIEDPCDYILA